MTSRDAQIVKIDFRALKRQKRHRFPKRGQLTGISTKQGVYVIYAPRTKRVVHVGRTYRGKEGLQQRLRNHLQGSSSFTAEYLKKHGTKLRRGYTFRFLPLPVKAWRRRALLEAYATGVLCPAHIGKNQRKDVPQSK